MKIRGFEVRQGVKYLLDVEGLPHHPADSFRVYVFVNQPDATLEQVRPDNPNFAGFFGIFGGEHAPAGEEEIRDQNQRPDPPTEHHIPDDEIQGTPVLDLTSAIAHIAESADNANRVDLTLTILATNVEGQQVETSDLPFTGISIRAEESISRKPSDRGHAAARQNHSVAMRDNRFSPLDITIQVGDTITWLNEGDNVHTATSDDGKFFNTGDVDPGNSSNPITFDEAGEFPYHCRHHGRMRGKVTVVAGGTPRPETP